MQRADWGAALEIARELGSADGVRELLLRTAWHTRLLFEEVARAAAPALGANRVAELAESSLSIIVAASLNPLMDRPPEVLRRELVTVARAYLLEAGLDAARFDEVMAQPSALAALR